MPETKSATAGWARVKLTAPQNPGESRVNLTEGELVLRADRVAVGEDELLFLVGEEVVFRLDRSFFLTLTWFVDRPTFGEWLKARRAQHPNMHKPWQASEHTRLAEELAAGCAWEQIAEQHGRTVSAVRKQAARIPAPPPSP